MMRRHLHTLFAFALAWSSATRAHADPDKPWAAGVSAEQQGRALEIYRDANKDFEQSRYPEALAKYRDALTHWDHPAIRFNMAVSLVNLDQPLEAYEHLEQAMKYGAEPLGNDNWAQAKSYKKLLEGQLTHLRVKCESDGAEVTLDGKPLLHCTGEATKILMPGEHQVVASKTGYNTETKSLVLIPGKELVHVVQLHPIVVKTKLVRRWPARDPWIVLGGGAGVAALGGLFDWLAYRGYKSYDDTASHICPCPPGKIDSSTKSIAHAENIAGVSLLAIGSTAVLAGILAVYLNQPRAIAEHAPVITPTVGSGTAGAAVTWTW
jgi:hypothetical protein